MRAYQEYVDIRTEHNPCIKNLANFFASSHSKSNKIDIVSLDFCEGLPRPEKQIVPLQELPQLLKAFHEKPGYIIRTPAPQADRIDCEEISQHLKILFVQDLTKDAIEILGNFLSIDPIFFASHIHTAYRGGDVQTSDAALLPSRIRMQKYINIHYHRTITFHNASNPPNELLLEGNLDRKVVVLPLTGRAHVGLAQHCISVLHVNGPQYDIGVYYSNQKKRLSL